MALVFCKGIAFVQPKKGRKAEGGLPGRSRPRAQVSESK